MADLPSGKFFKFGIAVCLVLHTACIFIPQEKPLNPKLLFTVGSAFLDSASTLALKGDIDFTDGRTTQSGKFTIFVNGRDSLALLVEGPLGVDVLRMLISGDSAYIYSYNDKKWISYYDWISNANIEYGISHFPPRMIGMLVFPQFYIHNFLLSRQESGQPFNWYGQGLNYKKTDDQSRIILEEFTLYFQVPQYYYYSHRKEIKNGYYPSLAELSLSGGTIRLQINKIRINPQIPAQVWERQ